MSNVLVTGGGGYVGCRLVPVLLDAGYSVRVFDRFLFGSSPLQSAVCGREVDVVNGDIRNANALRAALAGCDSVIHLAALSNDPSADLNEQETLEINRDAVFSLHGLAAEAGVQRIVNASSASIYGIRDERHVVESTPCSPVTLYARLKLETDAFLRSVSKPELATVSLRSATVAGYSQRMRLDLTANIFAAQAFESRIITVHGGSQTRPIIHIDDLVDAYRFVLEAPTEVVGGRSFNVTYGNYSVEMIANCVCDAMAARGMRTGIRHSDVRDARSYRLDQSAISRAGFVPRRNLRVAVDELIDAFCDGRISNLSDPKYSNLAVLVASGFGKESQPS